MNSPLPPIAHIIPCTGTAMGGPVQGMAAYTGLLARQGYPVRVLNCSQKEDGESVALDPRVHVIRGANPRAGGFRYSSELWREALAAEMGLVHSHGLWTDVHRLAGYITHTRKLPHLLAPCGMLAPGALRRHWWKKLPIRLWFQDRALREAQCLHAKSQIEYEHFRQFGLRNPVAVIANPIALPPPTQRASKEDFRRTFGISGPSRILLFLGRLHPVKGLPRLLEAWARLGKATSEWTLILAGPDEAGHRKACEALAAELGCEKHVVFTGELDQVAKWKALAAADLFVMPSDFENFGNSIVEAMSCGLPVITTTGTPWKELPVEKAGWWVEPTAEAVAEALREALGMPQEQRKNMGKRAAGLSSRFSPERVGQDLIQVYQWLLGKGPRPECVKVD